MLLLNPESLSEVTLGRITQIRHTYADDLESFFHLLFYEVTIHLPLVNVNGANVANNLTKFLSRYFEEGEYDTQRNRVYGGEQKLNFFSRPARYLDVDGNKPLTNLLRNLKIYFAERYRDVNYQDSERQRQLEERFSNPDYVLAQIDEALSRDSEWPNNDKLNRVWERYAVNKRGNDPFRVGNKPYKMSRNSTHVPRSRIESDTMA